MSIYYTADGTQEVKNPESGDFLRVSIDYQKGGTNWANGAQEKRGYYLYITKVARLKESYGVIEQHLFYSGGLKKFLLEVKRQSPKALEEARIIARQALPEFLRVVIQQAKKP